MGANSKIVTLQRWKFLLLLFAVIAYWEGRIRRYPDPECVHSKSKKDDAIFERLELR